FKVTFESRPLAVAEIAPVLPVTRRREVILAVCLAVAIACGGYFGIRLLMVERGQGLVGASGSRSASAWPSGVQQLWAPPLASDRRLMVCLSPPLFIHIPGFGFVRQSSSNDWTDGPDSKNLSTLNEALHVSGAEPTYGFTGVGTASGAFLLGQFLAQRKQDVL